MGFLNQFDRFNPLTGGVPTYPFKSLPNIASRARALLRGRTIEQISYIARTADWLVYEYFRNEREKVARALFASRDPIVNLLSHEERSAKGLANLLENWPENASMEPPYVADDGNTSAVQALKAVISGYVVLEGDEELPDAKEAENVATIALWMVADALRWQRACSPIDQNDPILPEDIFSPHDETSK